MSWNIKDLSNNDMTFEIFFSDLTDKAKKELLDFYGVQSEKELNMDIDIIPLCTITKED